MNPRKIAFPAISSTLVFLLGLTAPISAQDSNFDGGGIDSNWNTAANWDPDGVPANAGAGIVRVGSGGNSFTADITANVPTFFDLHVGRGASGIANGTVNHTAGSVTASNWALVGIDGDASGVSTGTYNISGSSTFGVGGVLSLGAGGGNGNSTGIMNVSGSAGVSANAIVVAQNDGNTGQMNISGGTVSSNNWMTVGETSGANGTLTMTGGSLNIPGDLSVGQQEGATGTMNVSGASIVDAGYLRIGRHFGSGGGATGNLNIEGSGATIMATNFDAGGESAAAADTTGNLSYTADAGGVTSIVTGTTFLNDGSTLGTSSLVVDLTAWGQFSAIGTGTDAEEIILIDSAAAVVGEFDGLAEGASVPIGGGQFGIISYVGGSGTDVTLTVLIPEPSVALLSALGIFGFVTRRRR
ncbi:MAG: PEP-CTERM sorting domain-containing protein [Verrucomicrobiota bacterium]